MAKAGSSDAGLCNEFEPTLEGLIVSVSVEYFGEMDMRSSWELVVLQTMWAIFELARDQNNNTKVQGSVFKKFVFLKKKMWEWVCLNSGEVKGKKRFRSYWIITKAYTNP
jgi:hypothetical protein